MALWLCQTNIFSCPKSITHQKLVTTYVGEMKYTMWNLINNISRSYLGWEEITDMETKMKTVVKNLGMNI